MRYRELLEAELMGYDLNTRFRELNAELFDNALPDIPLRYGVSKNVLGVFKAKHFKGEIVPGSPHIVINRQYVWTPELLDGVLVHEMIHAEFALIEHDLVENHGKKFLARRAELQTKVNFEIPISEGIKGLEIEQPNKPVVVAVRNDRAFMMMSESHWPVIKAELEERAGGYNYEKVDVYHISSALWTNKMRSQRLQRPKRLYKADWYLFLPSEKEALLADLEAHASSVLHLHQKSV